MVLSLDTNNGIVDEPGVALKQHVSIAAYTSYRVGGQADWLALPRSPAELVSSVRWAAQRALPITPLGAGSNLLVSDRGIPGLVVCSRHLRGTQFDDTAGRMTVAAGEPLPNLAWKAARRGWRGFEWAVGIPGTVGGATFMNAGAHGACLADSLVSAQAVTLTGDVIDLSPADLSFDYRTSSLQSRLRLITQATFQLSPGHSPAAVIAETQEALERRRSTQPYHLPSCGSVFRNPPPYTAGWLIERTGLKGHQIGQAQVSPMHANFIVNVGAATAQDVLSLIRFVQRQVEAQWDIRLHPEVRLLGHFEDSE